MSNDGPFSPDAAEAELDDAEAVLACLDRIEPGICDICAQLKVAGALEDRPALLACAQARSEAQS